MGHEITACLLCGGQDQGVYDLRDAKDGAPLQIARCQACGLVQLAQVPDDEALSRYYASEYRQAYRGSATPKTRNVYKAGVMAQARFQPLVALLPEGARLLDIGAGGGEFVYLAQRARLRASGIDPNGEYVAYAVDHLGIDLTKAEVADLPEGNRYEVVTMFHVLEHLAHPREVFAQVAALLSEGGLFVVEVPNLGSPSQPPANTFFKAHITYFTAPVLQRLAAPLFETVLIEDGKALYAVFRKRAAPVPVDSAGDAEAAAYSRQRMAARGWGEYLRHGGATAGFRKLAALLRTRRAIRGRSPRAVLEALRQPVQASGERS